MRPSSPCLPDIIKKPYNPANILKTAIYCAIQPAIISLCIIFYWIAFQDVAMNATMLLDTCQRGRIVFTGVEICPLVTVDETSSSDRKEDTLQNCGP